MEVLVGEKLKARGLTIATAESCTGGKGQTYYVRAFASPDTETTIYGEIKQFTTHTGDYYIKHCWGCGEWTWKKMTKDGDKYIYQGTYCDTGVNIHTAPTDEGAMWFPENEIFRDHYCSENDDIFIYDPQKETVTIMCSYEYYY